jgi:hypothetical protein
MPDRWTFFDTSYKLSLTDGQNHLRVDIVEVVECLHWWLGEGIVENILLGISMEELMDKSNNA